jgi:hypothetical protein
VTPLPGDGSLLARIEESFRRLAELSADTHRFLLVAAAEPVGDLDVVWRAAHALGVGTEAPAVDSGLVEVGANVCFRHPLVRSAAYELWPLADRQRAHGAFAAATDPGTYPDRRAWHLAPAALGPDEDVAAVGERDDRAAASVLLVSACRPRW